MRKLLLAIVAVALFAGMAMAQADATGTVNINVPVAGLFTISLGTNTITYPSLNQGDVDNTTGSVAITVRSNFKNAAWRLKVHQSQLLTDSSIPVETIPSANFTHTSTGGTGVHADAAATQFALAAATFYTCAAGEQKTTGAGLTINQAMQLSIPADQAAGTYTNTLTYTLTVTP